MAEAPLPKKRRDLARILKQNEFNIPAAADEIIAILNVDEEKHDSVTFLLKGFKATLENLRKTLMN